ncbi:MAG: signal peptidase I [Fimbriimonadales bacterium]
MNPTIQWVLQGGMPLESTSKVVVGLCSVLTAAFLLQPYRPVIVRGQSMAPTFRDGQLVFSVPMNRKPRDGDVVLVEQDGATLVKRIALIEGDKYREAYVPLMKKWLRVDGYTLEMMVSRGLFPCRMATVPPGSMFLLGDNPDTSLDSRDFGFLPLSSIRGLVPIGC